MDVRPTAVLALVLAYPTTFVLLTGEHSCGPVCLEPTAAGVAGLGGVVLASVAVAAVSSAVFALESRCAGKPFLEQLLCPNSVALAAIWACLVVSSWRFSSSRLGCSRESQSFSLRVWWCIRLSGCCMG